MPVHPRIEHRIIHNFLTVQLNSGNVAAKVWFIGRWGPVWYNHLLMGHSLEDSVLVSMADERKDVQD